MKLFLLVHLLVIFSFKAFSQSKPNILVLLIDDGSYNTYLSTGGPSFFTSPSINRIANEGVNFKKFFVTLSACNPSRCSFLTGLMPVNHHVLNNSDTLDQSIPTIGSILNDNGYYTAFLGKFPDIDNSEPRPGWDYWMASIAGGGLHKDGVYNLNGSETPIAGYKTYVLTDTVVELIRTVGNIQPFLIIVAYSAPHQPYLAPPGMDSIYNSETIPLPGNFHKYTENYPNEIYDGTEYQDTASCIVDMQNNFEMLAGVDSSIKRLFYILDSLNLTDSTLIVYTSDNGLLYGEHMLNGKEWAYDPSMQVPLFMRYPKWFSAGSVVDEDLTLNIDLAPTVLDAAGIPDLYNMDGSSLHDYYAGTIDRDIFYFQTTQQTNFRAIRSKSYKYVWRKCNNGDIEELFDLVNDPAENINLVNNSDYQTVLLDYRSKLDSLQIYWGDTTPVNGTDCFLVNPVYTEFEIPEETGAHSLLIYPNPANDVVTINLGMNRAKELRITVYDASGRVIYSDLAKAAFTIHLPVQNFNSGLYSVLVDSGDKIHQGIFHIIR